MKLTFLGTCAGTEPMPDRLHTSLAIEHDDQIFFVDAGETCSRTAHLMGIDLLSVRAIVITHPHIDHVGGLVNLLWTIRKLNTLHPNHPLVDKTIEIYLPDPVLQTGIECFLGESNSFSRGPNFTMKTYQDGLIYNQKRIRIYAQHNKHLGDISDGTNWHSYSLRLQTAERIIVISGDVKHVSELDPLIRDCDLLLMETGHHKVEDICHHLAKQQGRFGCLAFYHNGRAILADQAGELAKARHILGKRVLISKDKMTLNLDDVINMTTHCQTAKDKR